MAEYNKTVGFATDFALSLGGLVSSISQAQLYELQGQYAEKISEMNARFAEMESREVIEAGAREASEHGKQISQLVGSQRAGFAAGNIKVDSGTAAAIQQQTREIGYAEQREIRNNAWRQAFGLRTEAANYRTQGSAAKARAGQEASATLVTGGLRFAGNLNDAYRTSYGSLTSDKKATSNKEKPKADAAMIFDTSKYGGVA